MADNQKKILANLIKADLRDALNNDSRWKVEGTAHYFHNYIDAGDQIWVYTNNEEIKKALEENRLANSERRKAERERWEKYKLPEEEEIKLENMTVWSHDLEPADWQEIVSLIQQVRKMKEQKDEASMAEVERKLRSQKGLIYWPHREKRMSSMDEEGRLWYMFKTMENGKETWIYVPKNHPVLTNFTFEKRGFYLITGVDHIPSVKWKKYWREKSVSLQDNITITPFEVEEVPNIPNEKEKPINNPSDNFGKKDADKFVPLARSFLRQYFQKHGIKKISLKNGELIITHNDNKTTTNDKLTNNAEYLLIKDSLEKVNKSELTSQELGLISDNNSTPTTQPKNNSALWIGCGIGGALMIGVIIGLLLKKTNRKSIK